MTPAQVAHIMALVQKIIDHALCYESAEVLAARAAVEAALRDAPQAEGWVMVPVVPTDIMEVFAENAYEDSDSPFPDWKAAYRAMLTARPSAPTAVEPDERADEAPPNSLPTWDECALRVENSNFLAKRKSGGGYGPEHDSKTADDLHRFIYEYDDADPYRSAWFMHRLELAIDAARASKGTPL